MSTQRPQLHQGRDGERELYLLVNELRRNVPAQTLSVLPVGTFTMLQSQQVLCVPQNVNGWVTAFIQIIPTAISGVQVIGPDVQLGTVASGYVNVAPFVNLGTALVVGTVVDVIPAIPMVSVTDQIFLDIAAAGGPNELTAMLYIGGYYR
jgi:hypothetical protein